MSFATLPGPGSLQHGRDRLPEDRVRREIGHAAPLPRGRLTLPVGGDDLGDSLFVAQLAGVDHEIEVLLVGPPRAVDPLREPRARLVVALDLLRGLLLAALG